MAMKTGHIIGFCLLFMMIGVIIHTTYYEGGDLYNAAIKADFEVDG